MSPRFLPILLLALTLHPSVSAQETDINDNEAIADFLSSALILFENAEQNATNCKPDEILSLDCISICLDATQNNTMRPTPQPMPPAPSASPLAPLGSQCCCVANEINDNEFSVGIQGGCDAILEIVYDPESRNVSLTSRPTLEGGLRLASCIQVIPQSKCKTCTSRWTLPEDRFTTLGGTYPLVAPTPVASPTPKPSVIPVSSDLPALPPGLERNGKASVSRLRRTWFGALRFFT